MSSRTRNDPPTRAERSIRTFLIADIRGYTAFTRERGDEAAAILASRFAEVVREGVEAWDGELAELRGDEALAVFGSARRALRCAVELQDAFSHEVDLDPSLPLLVGMGLDAGEAVPVEEGYRGGALNLAARLCSHAMAGEVLASDGVVHLARATEGVRFEPVASLELKGLGSQDVVRVVAADEHPPRPGPIPSEDGAGDLPTALSASPSVVGRTRELRWLRWWWRRTVHGHGRTVVLDGPEGSGKTVLAAAIAAEVHAAGRPVTYVSSAEPSDVAVAELRAASEAGGLLVIDDVDAAPGVVLDAIRRLELDGADGSFVVLTCRDTGVPVVRDLIARVDAGGERHRTLGSLREGDVLQIATGYASDVGHLPLDRIERETAFQPGPVHRWLRSWVDSRARQRLEISATQAAEQGERMDRAATQLTEDVLELQLARAAAPIDLPADVCPYKGLAPFDDDDVDYFFGREQLVSKLVAALITAPFLGVTGPSGSGKSSLVRAGLVPAIAAGSLPGSDRWRRVVMRPGEHPIRELERSLGTTLPDDGLSAATDERLLLVVDQFEEIFTSCSDGEERAVFVKVLTDAAERGESYVSVVVAIRADFYGRCAAYPALASLLGDHHVLVGPMEPDELRRAIELPAVRVGLTVEHELVDALVAEVTDEPGGLPLLSTTLLELWLRRPGRVLTLASFQESGGVRGAVARLAETAYERLTDRQRQVARAILLRSAGPGEGAAAVRRRVPLTEFDVQRDEDVAHVLAALTDARLLTTTETTVEVAHEALLREWPRLRDWLEENAEGRRLHLHLAQTVGEWVEGGRDPADLFRGARLAAALDWTTEHALELNEAERQFLEESRASSERDAERQRRTNRRLQVLLVGTAVFLIVALIAGSLAVIQGGRARAQRSIAQRAERISTARELASASRANLTVDPERSVLLAIQAVETTRSADGTVVREAELALHDALVNDLVLMPIPGMNNFDYSPDGRRIVGHLYTEDDGQHDATVMDARTGERLLTLHGIDDPLFDVDWSPDGRWVAAQTHDGTIILWDPDDGRVERTIPSDVDGAGWIEFSPDGQRIAVTNADGAARVWDLSSGRRVATLRANRYGDVPGAMSWSPDGRELAVAPLDGRAIVVFDVASGRPRWAADGNGGGYDVQWSPKGDLIVTSGDTIDGWDAQTGDHRFTEFPGSNVVDLEFSRDGTRLAGGGLHGLAWVWAVERDSAEELLRLPSEAGTICCVTFSPNGRELLTGSGGYSAGSSTARGVVWNVADTGSAELFTLPATHGPASAEYTPDGSELIVSTDTGFEIHDASTGTTRRSVRTGAFTMGIDVADDGSRIVATGTEFYGVWDRSSGRELVHVFEPRSFVLHGHFSPDGTRVITSGSDPHDLTRIWDATTGDQRLTLEGHSFIQDAVFSPDGGSIAVADERKPATITLFNASTGVALQTLEKVKSGEFVNGLAWSPDGRLVAAGFGDGRLHLWTAGGRELYSIPAHDGLVSSIAFDGDGDRIATGGADGFVKLWDAATGDLLLTLSGHTGEVTDVDFSPDGTRLASASFDSTARVWVLDIDQLLDLARTRVTRSLTEDECQRYLHHACPASS